MLILVLNAGSSSLKFEIFETHGKTLKSLNKGNFDNHGKPIKDFEKLIGEIVKNTREIQAVGHRVVHGGEKYTKPTKITPAVIAEIRRLCNLAPLHNPPNLACILAAKKLLPSATQVAVFDTAFHQTMPERAYLYGLPYSFYKKFGIRRYGFHGTSHQYVFEQAVKRLGKSATRKTITCHLGNGCSIAAILNGKVMDTSMGFTPLEGVPMGTRSGDIDPAIIFYLLQRGFSAGEIEEILNKKSGLFGVSEISGDVRDLWAKYKKRDKKAVRALKLFAYRIAKYIGAYTATLGSLDCVVFTGGIGENAHYLRRWIMSYFPKFPKNRVLVVKTDEELKIAEETRKLLIPN